MYIIFTYMYKIHVCFIDVMSNLNTLRCIFIRNVHVLTCISYAVFTVVSLPDDVFARRYYSTSSSDIPTAPILPHACQYCEQYRASTEAEIETHWENCHMFPVGCPNECQSERIERGHLDEHLENECPLHVVSCLFAFAGCAVQVRRNELDAHMAEVKTHLSLLAAELHQVKQKVVSVTQENTHLKNEMRSLNQALHRVNQDQYELSSTVAKSMTMARDSACHSGLPPLVFTFPDYFSKKKEDRPWFSAPFYSHIRGYKMSTSIRAYAKGKHNKHLQVFLVIVRGDFDTSLSWPFKGKIVIELLNQAQNSNHFTATITYTEATDISCSSPAHLSSLYYPPSVEPGDFRGTAHVSYVSAPWGIRHFISHEQLETSTPTLRYIHNGCLQFRIASVVLT